MPDHVSPAPDAACPLTSYDRLDNLLSYLSALHRAQAAVTYYWSERLGVSPDMDQVDALSRLGEEMVEEAQRHVQHLCDRDQPAAETPPLRS